MFKSLPEFFFIYDKIHPITQINTSFTQRLPLIFYLCTNSMNYGF